MKSIEDVELDISALKSSTFIDEMFIRGADSSLESLKRELSDHLKALKNMRHDASQLEMTYE